MVPAVAGSDNIPIIKITFNWLPDNWVTSVFIRNVSGSIGSFI
jgi:hypothetical protein